METKRRIRADDLYRIRLLLDPQLSRDGRRVAFVLQAPDADADTYRSAIWVVPAAAGEAQQFTAGAARDTTPRWSPDGRRLAFLSDRSGHPQLHIMGASGGEARQVTRFPREHRPLDIAWAPDGQRLVLVVDETERPEGTDVVTLTRFLYRADDEGLLEGRRRHLWLVDLPRDEVRPLTCGDWDDTQPAWSPDGRSIAFVSARHPRRDGSTVADVWVVPAQGGEPRRVTLTTGPVSSPAWSPDGLLLAYLGHDQGDAFDRLWRVWVVPAAGGEPRCLTTTLDRGTGSHVLSDTLPAPRATPLAWAPDGGCLYTVVTDGGLSAIYQVELEGAARALTPANLVVRSFSAAGGRLAFNATDPLSPADLYVMDRRTHRLRRVVEGNPWLQREVSLTLPERLRFPSADGTTVEGWLLPPPDGGPPRRRPLVLQVHGGPHGAYGYAFFLEFHLLAAQGYLVLFTNPRGSHGYGQAFMGAIRGDWGHLDFQDLMAAVDHVAAQGGVDPERLAVMGGSYGGYMTIWALAHTDRFRCGISDRCVSNLLSMYGTSDGLGMLFTEYEVGATPWEDPQRYLEHSPVTHAPRIRTPLLLLHGEQDYRCPIAQSEELYTALKRLGREVVLVRFPGEGHELSRSGRPRHRHERLERIVAWLRQHLG